MPAYAIKIAAALPVLLPESFDLKNVKIYSKVLGQPALGRKPWFLFSLPLDLDLLGVSTDAILKQFPELQNSEKEVSKRTAMETLLEERKWIKLINDKAANGKRLTKAETALASRERTVSNEIAALKSNPEPAKLETKSGQIISLKSAKLQLSRLRGKRESIKAIKQNAESGKELKKKQIALLAKEIENSKKVAELEKMLKEAKKNN